MNSQAKLLLRNLLARLDADAMADRPLFRGIVSDEEREALRSLLEGLGPPTVDSSVEPPERREEEPSAAARHPTVELNTDALQVGESPAPGWVLCLDFGTAKSKAFGANNDEPPQLEPLPIGKADGDLDDSVHEVSSSIWIDDDGLLFMGSEAIRRGVYYGDPSTEARRRLDSLKQEISQVHPQDGPAPLLRKLPTEVDPTATLTYSDVITFYLAYLTDLATTALKSRSSTRYVRRRFTVPWWTDEQRRWAGDLLSRALLRAQLLADTFHGQWRKGIHVGRIKEAVDEAATHDEKLEWMLATESRTGVLEPLAAASARVWHDRSARDVMLVVDVGAGTTDLSLFWVVQKDGTFHSAFPIKPSGGAIRQAGDTLDSLLVAEILRKAGLVADSDEGRRVTYGLRRSSVRRLKETLFTIGTVVEDLVNDYTVTLMRDEFLKLKGIRKFEERIIKEIQGLLNQVHESWEGAAKDRITLVLTGGGCDLPMIRGLASKSWTLGERTITCRLAPTVPNFVAERFSEEFRREYPRLAVAMGGALKMRLDEQDAMTEWMGGAPRPGPLERF